MYKLSKRLIITAITLILVGAIGWVSSYTASLHLSLEDVKVMLADEHPHHGAAAHHSEIHTTKQIMHRMILHIMTARHMQR